jgi:hypothetical protein
MLGFVTIVLHENQPICYVFESLAVAPFISVGFLCNHVYNIRHKQIYEVFSSLEMLEDIKRGNHAID